MTALPETSKTPICEIEGDMAMADLLSVIEDLLYELITATELLTPSLSGPDRRPPISEALNAMIDFVDRLPIGKDLALSAPIVELALGFAELDGGRRPALFKHTPTRTGRPGNPPTDQARNLATAGFLHILELHGLCQKKAAKDLSRAFGKGGMQSKNKDREVIDYPTTRIIIWADQAEPSEVNQFVARQTEMKTLGDVRAAATEWAKIWAQTSRTIEKSENPPT